MAQSGLVMWDYFFAWMICLVEGGCSTVADPCSACMVWRGLSSEAPAAVEKSGLVRRPDQDERSDAIAGTGLSPSKGSRTRFIRPEGVSRVAGCGLPK